MTLQHVMAFTVTDDEAMQERVWNELPDWQRNSPDAIREMLTEQEVTAADRRVKFVTLKAYEKAGGATRRDLFSEGEAGVFIEDIPLLESLVAKKLEKTATKLRKEGWKWVEIRSSFDHEEWSECERRYPEPTALPSEAEAELQQLTEEREALWEVEEPNAEQEARFEVITERIEALEDRPEVWPAETLAIAGTVVTLGRDGKASIHTGLVKPEDAPEKPAKRKAAGEDGRAGDSPLP